MANQDPRRMHESMVLYARLLEARNRARRWFFINLAIAVIGGLLSLATYASAATNPEGGTYYVLWGAVAFGRSMPPNAAGGGCGAPTSCAPSTRSSTLPAGARSPRGPQCL